MIAISAAGENTALRGRLVIAGKSVSTHCDLVRDLIAEFHHTIRCVDRPADGTCVTYALELLEPARKLVTEMQELGVKPGCAFAEWLIENERLEAVKALYPGALLFYLDHGQWKHAAVVRDHGRIVSKWGTYAIFEHGLSEVPANYGNQVYAFRRPSAGDAARLFFEFGCEELGLKDAEADRLRASAGL